MNVHHAIATLRQRYQSGDESARDALQHLLRAYLLLIVRRAARPQNANSRVARGIRRLAGDASQAGSRARWQPLPAVDDVCRRLCDDLLQTPAVGGQVEGAFETIRAIGRTTACFGRRG